MMERCSGWWRFKAIAAWLCLAMLLGLAGCAPMPPAIDKPVSHALDPADASSALGRLFAPTAGRHPGRSGFKVLATGRAAFVARAELAELAERTLDLQYYSADDDISSNLTLLNIAAAAQRGVRVRVLLDDIYPLTRLFGQRALALHPNIDVRIFNPFFGGTTSAGRLVEFLFDSGRLNRRMHNKLWITDNAAALVGSRNLGDEYFGAGTSSNFADVEVLAAGPIVHRLSQAFDAYWNSDAAVPLRALLRGSELPDAGSIAGWLESRVAACEGMPPCSWLGERGLVSGLKRGTESLSWAQARFSWDAPDVEKQAPGSDIEHGSLDDPHALRIRRELLIVSPYFIPSSAGLHHLAATRGRGVRVAILTNSLASTDSPAAHAGYARHRTALLESGVELYETRPQPGVPHKRWHRWGHASPSSLHAKMIVQDRSRVVVGSFNQDPRSRLHNTEGWLEIDSEEVAADLVALFDEGTAREHAFAVSLSDADDGSLRWTTEEDGALVRHDAEPMTRPWLPWWRSLLGRLIPEHML
jgi:putative cardiolipin synthase